MTADAIPEDFDYATATGTYATALRYIHTVAESAGRITTESAEIQAFMAKLALRDIARYTESVLFRVPSPVYMDVPPYKDAEL